MTENRAEDMVKKIKETSEYIREKIGEKPEVAIILGSGLGHFAELLKDAVIIPYGEIPNFPVSTVKGHKGRFVCGNIEGKRVLAMQGRFHYYEGYDLQTVTFPIRCMRELGIEKLIVTNAAGGIGGDVYPGCLMLIEDHINFACISPLRGPNLDEYGPRFPDQSDLYSSEFNNRILDEAKALGIDLKRGNYAFMTGPQYESPAEVRALRLIGADAVGMSTVPEVTVAGHMGMRVTGISCISNLAAGISKTKLSHEEVGAVAKSAEEDFTRLVRRIISIS